MTSVKSTSLKVVRIAAFCWALSRFWAIRLRILLIGARRVRCPPTPVPVGSMAGPGRRGAGLLGRALAGRGGGAVVRGGGGPSRLGVDGGQDVGLGQPPAAAGAVDPVGVQAVLGDHPPHGRGEVGELVAGDARRRVVGRRGGGLPVAATAALLLGGAGAGRLPALAGRGLGGLGVGGRGVGGARVAAGGGAGFGVRVLGADHVADRVGLALLAGAGQDAAGRGRDVDVGLVGLHLADRLVLVDPLAVGLAPLEQRRLGHALAHLRHLDVDLGHAPRTVTVGGGLTNARVPAN